MATADVITFSTIHGFHIQLTGKDMELANTLCNELPRMNSHLNPGQEHIRNLAAIIGRHKMVGKFAAGLLHKHEDTPAGRVKLEVELKTMPGELIRPVLAEIVNPNKLDATLKAASGKWMKPVQFDSLDLTNIHGIVFKLNTEENCLVPFEFAEGPIPVSQDDNTLADFVEDFVKYVKSNDLANVIGLQFLGPIEGDGHHITSTAEFELGKMGTIALPTSILKEGELVPTSWPSVSWPSPGKPADGDPPAGQSWAKKVVNGVETHQVFVS